MNKTKISDNDPLFFINNIKDEKIKGDSLKLINFLKNITQWEPKIWGGNIIGFGKYHYHYKSGREGEFFIVGFSPKKKKFSFYTTLYLDKYEDLLKAIGIKDHGKACIYFKDIDLIDLNELEKLINISIDKLKENEIFEILTF